MDETLYVYDFNQVLRTMNKVKGKKIRQMRYAYTINQPRI
jgi:hypothetical protein